MVDGERGDKERWGTRENVGKENGSWRYFVAGDSGGVDWAGESKPLG